MTAPLDTLGTLDTAAVRGWLTSAEDTVREIRISTSRLAGFNLRDVVGALLEERDRLSRRVGELEENQARLELTGRILIEDLDAALHTPDAPVHSRLLDDQQQVTWLSLFTEIRGLRGQLAGQLAEMETELRDYHTRVVELAQNEGDLAATLERLAAAADAHTGNCGGLGAPYERDAATRAALVRAAAAARQLLSLGQPAGTATPTPTPTPQEASADA